MAAVSSNKKLKTPEVVVDETWFSDPDFCRESKKWCVLSKTLGEEAAWKFAKENNIDLVSINSSTVLGPLLQPTLNETSSRILNLLNGAQTFSNFVSGWVNVRDVANAHIQAFEISSASGRYCLVESVTHVSDIVKILRALYPTLQLPESKEGEEERIVKRKKNEEWRRKSGVYDPRKVEHLYKLEGAKERLQLYKASLMEEGSFDSILDGCHGVFHTASPCFLQTKDPQSELIDPAVKGTVNVLRSCAKSPSVKRVVLTSSTASVNMNGRYRSPEVVVDETWLSEEDLNRKSNKWYVVSKILQEEAAWKFAKENNIDLITMHPATVLGPLLQPTLNETSSYILNLINGSETYPNYTYGWIHVRDVANAHIQAFEISSANGRYCLVESVAHFAEIVKILHQLYPTLQLPNRCVDDQPLMPTYQVSKEKAKTLGVEFIPLEVGLKETVESLREKNFVNF
ncbi:cinnamoyl-CoA reductase 1-like [Senna tora]|uniref:Cinnamoyl-CoA reductase 1-like n=1 Tax=Senna tora TaxID=362788 RepID=A0A835CB62_9FABA|nr:cinnamoyl-CoA reductase 1-like [Senna tora]